MASALIVAMRRRPSEASLPWPVWRGTCRRIAIHEEIAGLGDAPWDSHNPGGSPNERSGWHTERALWPPLSPRNETPLSLGVAIDTRGR
jgi:hypothetical protein